MLELAIVLQVRVSFKGVRLSSWVSRQKLQFDKSGFWKEAFKTR